MKHFLKCDLEWYDAVSNGIKTFELRKNDRDFKVGDTIVLEAKDKNDRSLTLGWRSAFAITHVFVLGDFIAANENIGYVILSLKPTEPK